MEPKAAILRRHPARGGHHVRQRRSRQDHHHRQRRTLPRPPRLLSRRYVGLRNLDLLLGLEKCINYTTVEVLNGDCRLDQALVQDKYCLLCNMGMRNSLQASALILSTS
ncbi:hypothetical protein Scep_014218 [Stephania cephalantha]|uniref:Uncharacterized protein n=1 Tax=Stephania cephalantha TaxID=152367 RepID=A0AAP0J2W2_9MAGN